MKYYKPILLLFFLLGNFQIQTITAQDWANLKRFENENNSLKQMKNENDRIVFMGNSITEGWLKASPDFFANNPYLNRGISGQTTPQMLLRFRQDVIDLKPKMVVILAGTNDIAGNTGPITLPQILDNIKTMSELAQTNNIEVVLSSVLPAYDFPWRPNTFPAEKIEKLNEMIFQYAQQKGFKYLDYYAAMVDERKGLPKKYSEDGVHPNRTGYLAMQEVFEKELK